jgi:hypothetical protein
MGWVLITNLFAARWSIITNHPGFDRMECPDYARVGRMKIRGIGRAKGLSASRPANGLLNELLVAGIEIGLAIMAQLNVDDT